MADERLSFRRGERAPGRGLQGLVVAFLFTVGAFVATRSWWEPTDPLGVLVEVRGEVPHPGLRVVDPPSAAAALRAAGADPDSLFGVPDGPLVEGQALVVEAGGVRVSQSREPLLVALPIDVNRADAAQLTAVPGVGARVAEAVVADRDTNGPFRSVDELVRVSGVGASTMEQLRPFVTADAPPPLDLNVATASQLESLPGVGPVLAARIVVDRSEHGAYRRVEDLVRVKGVRADTVDALRTLVVVAP